MKCSLDSKLLNSTWRLIICSVMQLCVTSTYNSLHGTQLVMHLMPVSHPDTVHHNCIVVGDPCMICG